MITISTLASDIKSRKGQPLDVEIDELDTLYFKVSKNDENKNYTVMAETEKGDIYMFPEFEIFSIKGIAHPDEDLGFSVEAEAKGYAQGFKDGMESRPSGEWKEEGLLWGGYVHMTRPKCSECGSSLIDLEMVSADKRLLHKNDAKYCPNCGAKMIKESE